MAVYNGRVYIGKYSASEEVAAMLKALGVKTTAAALGKLQRFCGAVLYKSAIEEAAESTVVALKAQAACQKLLGSFQPAPAAVEAFSAWQALAAESATETAEFAAALEALAAFEAEHNLPAGSIKPPTASSAGKQSIAAAEEAKAAYVALVVGQFKQHLKLGIANAAASEYATTHYSAVANMEKAGIASASVTLGSTKRASGGNGTRRGFQAPLSVAGIPWSGSWKATASQLLAAGTVEAGNFVNNPALGRAARALKDKQFVFSHGTYTGAHILANLEAFKRQEEAPEPAA